MIVSFDASILICTLNDKARTSVDRAKDRVDFLIQRLSDAGVKIVVPTPALSECLIHAGPAGTDYLTILNKQSCFRISNFDQRAAIETAIMIYDARKQGQIKGGNPEATKTKIKFDRQIVAIAKVEGAAEVYSDDDDVCGYARAAGMKAFKLADLPLPPEDPQGKLEFDSSKSG